MRKAAIVMPMRTPVGLPGGALAAVTPHRLIATALSAVLGRSGIDPARVDHLVSAVPTPAAVRAALPLAGLSPAVSEFAVGPGPGSGLRALVTAAMMVQSGAADVVLAVGADYTTGGARAEKRSLPVEFHREPAGFTAMVAAGPAPEADDSADTGEQALIFSAAENARDRTESELAELLARRYAITRAEADHFAADSHRRAARARRQGIFGAETAPVIVCANPDDVNSDVVQLVDRDEGLRDDVSDRAFALLEPLLPGGVLTLGNSSTRTLAASACLVIAEDRLPDLGVDPMAFLVGWSTATGNPGAAVPATGTAVEKTLSRTGIGLDDLDLVEIDETSAVEVLALTHHWQAEGWSFDAAERLNVHGAAIALGDPGGAAGLRLTTTLLHELTRRQGEYGLAAIPTGPNQAMAALFESPYLVPVAPTPRGARFHGARPPRRFGRHRA